MYISYAQNRSMCIMCICKKPTATATTTTKIVTHLFTYQMHAIVRAAPFSISIPFFYASRFLSRFQNPFPFIFTALLFLTASRSHALHLHIRRSQIFIHLHEHTHTFTHTANIFSRIISTNHSLYIFHLMVRAFAFFVCFINALFRCGCSFFV